MINGVEDSNEDNEDDIVQPGAKKVNDDEGSGDPGNPEDDIYEGIDGTLEDKEDDVTDEEEIVEPKDEEDEDDIDYGDETDDKVFGEPEDGMEFLSATNLKT